MKLKYFLVLLSLFYSLFTSAQINDKNSTRQVYTQTLRGTVVDKLTRTPLTGANVILVGAEPFRGEVTDENGNFKFNDVPVGRQSIEISFIGYHSSVIKEIAVNSAKESVILIQLEEKVEMTDEVTVLGNSGKDRILNQLARVSARTFSVEEARRYAGSREDVARMAMNYAGVFAVNDFRNDIVVRGNTPSGILWRLEDVDIPNPNHFAVAGATGGIIGMLNNNTLRNSDFYTSAFPAEFANVFSGVFDLNMREGNNENYEFLGQVGFNGFELGAEGPFKKGGKSSFLANYRYSTLKVFDLLGINVIDIGVPNYQDLNFKVNVPLKKGKISWFGLTGNSSIAILDSDDRKNSNTPLSGTDIINGSSMFVSGLTYSRFHSANSYSKFILSYISQRGTTEIKEFRNNETPYPTYEEDNKEERFSFKYLFNSRLNRRFLLSSGFTLDQFGYFLYTKFWHNKNDNWIYILNNKRSMLEGALLLRAFSQAVYKFSDKFEIKPGINYMHFGLNGKSQLEPRLGISWKTGYASSLNFGYGLHSRVQNMSTYFYETEIGGEIVLTNKDLDFTKAHHAVLGFDALLAKNLRGRIETYYQYLFDVPVRIASSSYSLINMGADWGLNTSDRLANIGKGYNYGVELTLEKFYSSNYYFLTTLSLFESKYTGSDGVWRNTVFNGNFVYNFLAGKEFKINNNASLVFDIKTTWAGGRRFTPIDIEKSRNSINPFPTFFIEERAYEGQFENYFKSDVKIGFKLNQRRISQTWEVYLENITNNRNPLIQSYSRSRDDIITTYQLGFLPSMNYRIYF